MALSLRSKVLITISSLLLVVLFFVYIIFFAINYSEGYRAGTIVKMSKKGSLVKTCEGQLSTTDMKVWDFSVVCSNTEVLKAIEEAADHGYRVKLFYNEKYFQVFWRGDTKYFVYKVEKVQN